MDTEFRDHGELHLLGANATRSMEPRCSALAVLLVLAGMSPPRRRAGAGTPLPSAGELGPQDRTRPASALPARPIAAHSGASNCGF